MRRRNGFQLEGLKSGDGFRNDALIAAGKVEAADDGVKRDVGEAVTRVRQHVDDAGM
jgi:hypothetical protein